jgi:hypothetical protein
MKRRQIVSLSAVSGRTLAFGGGWGGIRTPGTRESPPVFKTGAFNHSATHPSWKAIDIRGGGERGNMDCMRTLQGGSKDEAFQERRFAPAALLTPQPCLPPTQPAPSDRCPIEPRVREGPTRPFRSACAPRGGRQERSPIPPRAAFRRDRGRRRTCGCRDRPG